MAHSPVKADKKLWMEAIDGRQRTIIEKEQR